jgi:protein TonB
LVITLTLPEQEQQTSVVEIVAESADSAELTAAVTELAQQATEIGRRKRAQHVVQPAENTTSTTVERANQLDQPAPEPAASAQPARPKRQRFQSASIDVAVRVDHQPDFSQNQPPKYPRVAVINRWEGEVILQLHVDASGAVVRVAVAQSSGYAVLDDAAVRAVSQWRGAPARRGSRNVGTVERLPIRFQLPR